MKIVGELSNGNIIVETDRDELGQFLFGNLNPDPKELGVWMKNYRKKHQLTQEELARRIGISRNRVSQIENEPDPNITIRTFIKILGAVGGI